MIIDPLLANYFSRLRVECPRAEELPLKLPNAADAVIDGEKLRDYLLSPAHPIGRFKAAHFRSLGYSQDNWAQLESDLREQHLPEDVNDTEESRYGVKYVIRANLKGPNGKMAELVSVWIVLTKENVPRFVTVYPGDD